WRLPLHRPTLGGSMKVRRPRPALRKSAARKGSVMVGVRPKAQIGLALWLSASAATVAGLGVVLLALEELAGHDTAMFVVVPVVLYAVHAVGALSVVGAGGLSAADRAALAASALVVAHVLFVAATGRLGTGAMAYAVLVMAAPLPF